MGLRMKTIEKLADRPTCERIIEMLEYGISKKYIRQTFGLSERELQRIIESYLEDCKIIW